MDLNMITLTIKIFLSIIFLISGIAKIVNQQETRQTIRAFGFSSIAPTAALLLPIVELVISALLFFSSTVYWGALGSLFLLLFFNIFIGNLIRKGITVDCNCFGALSKAPTGWNTIYRNIGLMLLSLVLIVPESITTHSAVVSETPNQWLIILLMLFVLLQGVMIVLLMDKNEINKTRLIKLEKEVFKGLPIGTPAPPFEFPNLMGERIGLKQLLAQDKPLILVFFHHDCAMCRTIIPKVITLQKTYSDKVLITFIGTEDKRSNALQMDNLLILDAENEKFGFEQYKIHWHPSAVYINPKGKIGSFPATGEKGITALIEEHSNRIV